MEIILNILQKAELHKTGHQEIKGNQQNLYHNHHLHRDTLGNNPQDPAQNPVHPHYHHQAHQYHIHQYHLLHHLLQIIINQLLTVVMITHCLKLLTKHFHHQEAKKNKEHHLVLVQQNLHRLSLPPINLNITMLIGHLKLHYLPDQSQHPHQVHLHISPIIIMEHRLHRHQRSLVFSPITINIVHRQIHQVQMIDPIWMIESPHYW